MNMLIYGYPGAGKTRLMGTVANVPEMMPALFLDVESGYVTIQSVCESVELNDVLMGKVTPNPKKIQVAQIRSIVQFEQLLKVLKQGTVKYKTVIVDTYSELSESSLLHFTYGGGPAPSTYTGGVKGAQFAEYRNNKFCMEGLTKAYRDFSRPAVGSNEDNFHFLITTHLHAEENDSGAVTMIGPNLTGKMRTTICGYVDAVGFIEQSAGKTILKFSPFGLHKMLKTRYAGLMQTIENPTFPEIYKKVKSNG